MWKCLNCGESVEDNFESCWSCGHKKDGSPRENQAEFDAARDEALRTEKDSGDTAAGRFGRRLGRSRAGRVVAVAAAMAVAAFFFGLAAYAQKHQKEAVDFLTIGLAYYGLVLAWRVLPIPASVRARWAKEKEQSENGPLKTRYRDSFWLATVWLFSSVLQRKLEPSDFAAPGLLFAIGAFQFVLFRRSLRHSQSGTGDGTHRSPPSVQPVS